VDVAYLLGQPVHHGLIDAVARRTGEDLAAQLEEDALVARGQRTQSWPSRNRMKRRTTMFSPVLEAASWTMSDTLRLSSRMYGCSSRHTSAKNLSSLPVMILSRIAAGLPLSSSDPASTSRSRATRSAGTSSRRTNSAPAAAACMAM